MRDLAFSVPMIVTTTVNPDRILQARLAANMSRADLAYAIRRATNNGIRATERGVARWESGVNRPSDGVVPAIARVTGQTIEFFYSSETPGGEEPEEGG